MKSRCFVHVLLGVVLLVSACTLSQEADITTPTLSNTPTLSPSDNTSPTMFPSITPVGGAPAVEGIIPTNSIPEMLDGRPICTLPVGWVEYTVQAGDILSELAEQTGSTVTQLVEANCLENADDILSGQVIYLPREPLAG
jgi:nucleoid-associated protein YgaU